MFAGAAREAVFSDAKVVERVKKEFVPVALKAGLMNNPPGGAEGRVYGQIGLSKPAPQGICAVNGDGRVLAWTLMFEGKDALQEFLDHVLELNEAHPAGCESFDVERYMKFPGDRLDDFNGVEIAELPKEHKDGERCPGELLVAPGTLVGTIYGRTFKDGSPSGNTSRQERYLESRVEISPEWLSALVAASEEADGEEFDIPSWAAAGLCGQAFLGQLDVNPGQGENAKTSLKLKGKVEEVDGDSWIRIEGTTSMKNADSLRDGEVDGRQWSNDVTLTWMGLARIEDGAVTRVILTAEGREKLNWGHSDTEYDPGSALDHLPAGRGIRLDSDVKFGVIATPAKKSEIGTREGGGAPPKCLVDKMKRLKAGMDDAGTTTKQRQKVAKMMEEFEPLMRKGKFEAAEEVLDEALEVVK